MRVAAEIQAGADGDAPARQALAGVVVRIADQLQRDALAQEGAERLAARALELNADGVVGQAFGVHLGHRARQHGADRAVDVARRVHDLDSLALVDGGAGLLDQAVVERFLQPVVLRGDVEARHIGRHVRLREQAAEVQAPGLPVRDALLHVEQVAAADQVVELADAQLRHDLAHLFSDEEEVVDHVFGLAGELGAQHRILRGHADRAGVEVALAHHDAAFDHQRRGGEAEFVGAQQRADGDVAAGLHLAVGLHADAATQAVQHQRLLRFGQADFPRRAGVLDRRPRRRARAAVVPGDHHVVALALGHAGGDGADPDLGHQLDADVAVRRHVLQVVDQLRQVLDRIDVVVRRRADEAHARHAVAQASDVVADLATRQLAALAGLGALRHLDLDLVGAGQVFGRDAEAARGHLLDAAAQAVAFGQRQVDLDHVLADHRRQRGALLDRDALQFLPIARRVLAALAGVALAADAVHGDGQRGVGFR